MGPIAVPKSELPKALKVVTRVNGELRQQGSTDDLIFSVRNLIKTLSEGQTLRPGLVIATGTPFGVGFGLDPPTFLKTGDVVEVSVTGLGTLRNKVSQSNAQNPTPAAIEAASSLPVYNLSITGGGKGLHTLRSGKQANININGSGPHMLVLVHGLGGSMSYYTPLLQCLDLSEGNSAYTIVTYDFEGHGMSPTAATSEITIKSLAQDLGDIIAIPDTQTDERTIIAHSMGCHVAELFAAENPHMVDQLVLIGPPPCPLPAAGVEGATKRAATVRSEGMRNVAEAVASAGTSSRTKTSSPLAMTAVKMSLLSQDPEGYAKGCTALASAGKLDIDLSKLRRTLIIAGDEDKFSPPTWTGKLAQSLKDGKLVTLNGVGHWHVFEDVDGVGRAIRDFL